MTLCTALTMPFSIRALADEVVIPEEAVEVIETGEETPAEVPAAPTETTDDSSATTDSGTTETTDTPATDPTTTDTPTEGAGNGEVVDDGTDGETEESLTDTDAETEELTEDQLNALLQESTESDEIMLLELDPEEDVDPQADSTVVTTYKYAVQIYDIGVDTVWNDTDGDGAVDDDELTTGGLTFGPAVGGNYISASKSHTVDDDGHISDTDAGTDESGNAYRCVHNDDWGSLSDTSSIIYWNSKDPHVYDKCLANNCTKSVPLTLTSENSESTKDSNGQLGYQAFYSGVTTSVTGDGPGVLIEEIARSNQRYSAKANQNVIWVNSKIRAVLNGMQSETSDISWDKGEFTADTNSVLSAFPSELQSAIGKKAVQYATAYDSKASSATCYDKLWLLSNVEIWGSSFQVAYAYTGEGTQYVRMQNVANADRIAYSTNSNATYRNWWTRSRSTYGTNTCTCVRYNDGLYLGVSMQLTDSIGLAPGFVLTRTTMEAEDTEYKYAVQIYGIGVDQVYENKDADGNVTTVTGGLTFGPAIGGNYTGAPLELEEGETADGKGQLISEDYRSCTKNGVTKTGTTAGGNDYRCVHDDDWGSETTEGSILYWNIQDPHVYDYCVTNGCTKTIPLTMTEANFSSSEDSGKVFLAVSGKTPDGDGPGNMVDIIQPTARKYADLGDAGLTYANSKVRAALNGAQDETNATYGGTDYSVDNSVLSAFPENLRNAIGAKAVGYASGYSDLNSGAVCYDKLWLLSVAELGTKQNNQTKYTKEGTAYTWPASVYSAQGKTQAYEVYVASNTLYSWSGPWWLRTRYSSKVGSATRINAAGGSGDKDVTDTKETGLAPGFTLYRPAEENGLVDLPVTGGSGRNTIYAMAVALAVLAMIGLAYRRQRIH